MGNPANVFDLAGEDLATFLAKAVSDGTWADVFTTTKVDKDNQTTAATAVREDAGALWSNAVDDYIRATYPLIRGALQSIGASVDNAVALWDGTDGAAVKASLVTIDSDGNILSPSAIGAQLILAPELTGGDFGEGNGNGTWLELRGGDGGDAGGDGGSLDGRAGDALAGDSLGGTLRWRSGNSKGTSNGTNVEFSVGSVDTGKLGVVQITNTALGLPELDPADLVPIEPGQIRLAARDDGGFSQPIMVDDSNASHDLVYRGFISYWGFTPQSLAAGNASIIAIATGFGHPTSDAEILEADWIDPTGNNSGSPPAVNGRSFTTAPSVGATIEMDVIVFDLDTTLCTATDVWVYAARARGCGPTILFVAAITA